MAAGKEIPVMMETPQIRKVGQAEVKVRVKVRAKASMTTTGMVRKR